jgi:hypothetical protein
MISDVLLDGVASICQYRADFPGMYGADSRMNLWLDAITVQMTALAEAIGQPPPRDDRTVRGECRSCREIKTIAVYSLTCDDCAAVADDLARRLLAAVYGGDDPDDPEVQARHEAGQGARYEAAHRAWLDDGAERIVSQLRRLDRADRDHILNAITRALMDAV